MYDKSPIERLKYLISKVPPTYQDWSYQAVQDYKRDIAKAKKVCGKNNPTNHEVESAISLMMSWWGGH